MLLVLSYVIENGVKDLLSEVFEQLQDYAITFDHEKDLIHFVESQVLAVLVKCNYYCLTCR